MRFNSTVHERKHGAGVVGGNRLTSFEEGREGHSVVSHRLLLMGSLEFRIVQVLAVVRNEGRIATIESSRRQWNFVRGRKIRMDGMVEILIVISSWNRKKNLSKNRTLEFSTNMYAKIFRFIVLCALRIERNRTVRSTSFYFIFDGSQLVGQDKRASKFP